MCTRIPREGKRKGAVAGPEDDCLREKYINSIVVRCRGWRTHSQGTDTSTVVVEVVDVVVVVVCAS